MLLLNMVRQHCRQLQREGMRQSWKEGYSNGQEVLVQVGGDDNVDVSTRDRRAAIEVAAEGGHEKMVVVLLVAGADVNAAASGYHGRTALQAAAEGGHETIVERL